MYGTERRRRGWNFVADHALFLETAWLPTTLSFEVTDIIELVVSPDGSEGGLVVMTCTGGHCVQLVFGPDQIEKLGKLLALANTEEMFEQRH